LQIILDSNISISRFGDGEIRLINSEYIEFQKKDLQLTERLKQVLKSDLVNHKVCISGVFGSLSLYTNEEKYFWRKHLSKYRKIWLNNLNTNQDYLNTFITRPYMPYEDKTNCLNYFQKIKQLWQGKDILIVEGEQTRLGYLNDLFDNIKSVKRILCPSRDAFSKYNSILNSVIINGNNCLVLIALGPTATVLAYDLAMKGIRAIDLGHLDIEYEWFKLKTMKKVKIVNKYTNEAVYDKSRFEAINDKSFTEQVVEVII